MCIRDSVGVVRKRAGAVRYVVEDDRGALHIFRGEQLRRPPQATIGIGWAVPSADPIFRTSTLREA